MAIYSFCESTTAGPRSPWHIRELTSVGKKLGGGIDTKGLCGFPRVTYGWDLDVEIVEFHLEKNTCPTCALLYESLQPYAVNAKVKHELADGTELHGHVEVVKLQDTGPAKYHVRWSTGDLLFYDHDDLWNED